MAETKRALATLLTNISDGGSNTAEEVRDAILTLFDGLYTDSTKSASFTAVEGSLYPISIASLGANIDVTFPATPAAGDTFGFYVAIENTTDSASSGFAAAPFWGVEPLATTDINNVSYTQAAGDGMGKWGLMLDGEILIFRYDAVTATWVVVHDGRSPFHCKMRLTNATQASIADATWTILQFDEAQDDNAGLGDAASETLEIKRAITRGTVSASVYTDKSGTDKQSAIIVNKNDGVGSPDTSSRLIDHRLYNSGTVAGPIDKTQEVNGTDLSPGDVLRLWLYNDVDSGTTTVGASGNPSYETQLAFTEHLT